MIFETERLYTRELNENDWQNLARTLEDEKAMYAYEHVFGTEEVTAWLQNNLRRYKEDGYGLWAVIRKEDEQFVGQCGLTKQTFQGKKVLEIGYLLERKYWHGGYAIEVASGAKSYSFDELDAPEVWSIIRDTNLSSMNVAIRNQMLVQGIDTKDYYGLKMSHYGFKVTNKEAQN